MVLQELSMHFHKEQFGLETDKTNHNSIHS